MRLNFFPNSNSIIVQRLSKQGMLSVLSSTQRAFHENRPSHAVCLSKYAFITRIRHGHLEEENLSWNNSRHEPNSRLSFMRKSLFLFLVGNQFLGLLQSRRRGLQQVMTKHWRMQWWWLYKLKFPTVVYLEEGRLVFSVKFTFVTSHQMSHVSCYLFGTDPHFA